MSGVLNHRPERIIQQLLVDLGGLVTDPPDGDDWPCFSGLMPDTPDNCVSVADTDGLAQGREHVSGYLFEKHGIQIRFRSDGPVDGYVKAARVLQALNAVHNVEVTVMDDSGTASSDYRVQSVMPKTPVIKLGPEPSSRRYLWTLNSLVSVRIIV